MKTKKHTVRGVTTSPYVNKGDLTFGLVLYF